MPINDYFYSIIDHQIHTSHRVHSGIDHVCFMYAKIKKMASNDGIYDHPGVKKKS